MDNYIAVVFDTDAKAAAGLHSLWDLDTRGDITVHGAAVIHRDQYGYVQVATKNTDPGVRTALGASIAVGTASTRRRLTKPASSSIADNLPSLRRFPKIGKPRWIRQ